MELAESRARIAAAGADARRRLEGELHDTAQNRLVGLQIPLRLAQDRTEQPAPLRPTASPTSRGAPGRFHDGAGVLASSGRRAARELAAEGCSAAGCINGDVERLLADAERRLEELERVGVERRRPFADPAR